MKHTTIDNYFISQILVEELSRSGFRDYFISPGSRSTPLTAAAVHHPDTKVLMHFDERGSAFAALGYARATHKPGILICTSGSAAANYFPAVAEASADNIPLIILTADRPTELQKVRANQTMDQQYLYGKKISGFLNIEPTADQSVIFSLLFEFSSLINNSIVNKKPVQINCMFREPLMPGKKLNQYRRTDPKIKKWRQSDKPLVRPAKKQPIPKIEIEKSAEVIDSSLQTIIVAAAGLTVKEQKKIVRLAESKHLPVFPDIRSGLRLHTGSENIITYFDRALLSDVADNQELQVLHFGGNIVSKRFLEWIEKSKIKNYIVIENTDIPYNPHHKMTRHLQADVSKTIDVFTKKLKLSTNRFIEHLKKKNKTLSKVIDENCPDILEASVARTISKNIKQKSVLFISSSMPIRDFDMYASHDGPSVFLSSNRGLSGIDGTIASTIGFSLGHKKRATVLLGDLALMHDLNSLALLHSHPYPVTIVVINNNGGGIFSFLPVKAQSDIFEPCFGTPHNLVFKAAADMFDISYHNVATLKEFQDIYMTSQKKQDSILIEVTSDREINYNTHIALQKIIKKRLSKS